MDELSPQSLIKGSLEIFSLPDIYFQIAEMIADPRYTAIDLGNVIAKDPGLSIRLLKIVNSSFYGFQAKVDTISRAITIVGVEDLKNLVLATSVIDKFSKIPVELVDMTDFWMRSVRCGVVAKLLAKKSSVLHCERLFLAGLLHDVGSLVMYSKIPAESQQILQAANYDRQVVAVIERQGLGFTHADVGFELIKSWGLPESLFEAVGCHLEPELALVHRLDAHLLNLAFRLSNSLQQGVLLEDMLSEFTDEYLQFMRLDRSMVAEVVELTDDEFSQVYELMVPGKKFH
ncbi:MAG: HDOD domain-containing protein [Methylococcales bacterium]